MNRIELVERYLNEMADHLPKKEREDVVNEMRSNIMDMLPDDPTEDDVRTVLEKLGDPVSLANEYLKDRGYIIGLSVYNSYFSVLKMAIGISFIVLAFLSLLGILFDQPGSADIISVENAAGFSVDLLIEILLSAFQGALIAFVWVTVIFLIIDRVGVNRTSVFRKKGWTIDKLPQPSAGDKGRISRVETAIGLLGSIFFSALLLKSPNLIGWYEDVNGVVTLKASFFNNMQLKHYVAAILMFACVQFVLSIYKFVVKRWNLPMAIFNTVNNIALSVFVFVISKDTLLINPEFVALFTDMAGWTAERATTAYPKLMTGFVVFFILMSTIDSVSGFVKSRRLKLPSINIDIK